ncbi:MAG: SUMF1/EgtB/PvdO family nonheme iron enzyme [Abditibacteriaceae bacterium]
MRTKVLFFSVLSCVLATIIRVNAASAVPPAMVLVPAGSFVMGTNNADREGENVPRTYDDARPQHSVTLPAFYIDKTEVTNAAYLKFCRAINYPLPPDWKQGTYPVGEADFPVTRISWYEADAYAHWVGKRLPTEAEWEKAARGTDGRMYPWGNDWDAQKLVWNRSKPDNVGSKPEGASPYGALDMAGNIFEWTSDWYTPYPKAPVEYPEYNTTLKIVRGGGYYGYNFVVATFYRSVDYPRARSEWIGFRCAKDAS